MWPDLVLCSDFMRSWTAPVRPSQVRDTSNRISPKPFEGIRAINQNARAFYLHSLTKYVIGPLGRCRRPVLIHEHGNAGDDEDDEEILEGWVSLPTDEDAQNEDRDGLAALADDLGGVVDPEEGLVACHHGGQVGEGADGVVGRPRRVLARLPQDEFCCEHRVGVIDHALDEHQGERVREALRVLALPILASGSENLVHPSIMSLLDRYRAPRRTFSPAGCRRRNSRRRFPLRRRGT